MNLLPYIEYTLLKPDAAQREIEQLIDIACEFKPFGICLPPYWVKLGKRNLLPGICLVTVAGFPLGYQKSAAKMKEIEEAIADGADEIDIVMNVSAFKTGMAATWVKPEIARAAQICHDSEKMLKVILETAYLSESEIAEASSLCADAGADFVKTSTGFAPEGAKTEHIKIMKNSIPATCGIKASAGIRTKAFALELIEAGATRIGTSAHPSIFM